MNKMFFELEQHITELLTPTITHDGVNEINPILTSSQICQLDDNEIDFNEKVHYELVSQQHSHDNSDEQHQEDIFSTFDLPVLNELNHTDSTFDGIQIDKYINQNSFPSRTEEIGNVSMSEDSTFYPVEDSNSSASVWVGNECVVETMNLNEMTLPPSPSLSSASTASRVSKTESTKKCRLSATERKLRKKDQNKTAAEKYRLKKRTEKGDLIAHHTTVKNQNRELKYQLETLTFQLEQFKQLFVDVLQIPIPSNISH